MNFIKLGHEFINKNAIISVNYADHRSEGGQQLAEIRLTNGDKLSFEDGAAETIFNYFNSQAEEIKDQISAL